MSDSSRLVQRGDIVDIATYEDQRPMTRPAALEAKQLRRVQLGPHLSFAFENRETMIYQIQEIMRAERTIREADIAHEIDTYNALLGAPGELACVLMIGVEDPAERDAALRRWRSLPHSVYVELDDGSQVNAAVDAAQADTERLSAVQYLRFDVRGRAPVALGVDTDLLGSEATPRIDLPAELTAALAEDLQQ